MRKFKTSKKKRNSYIYYYLDGTHNEIVLGMDAITEEHISLLHEWDDYEVDAYRKSNYKISYSLNENNEFSDGQVTELGNLFPDNNPIPIEKLLQNICHLEKIEQIERLKVAIESLTQLQKQTLEKKYLLNKKNVEIATEEGVSKMAITNRLKKIYAKLQKEIKAR